MARRNGDLFWHPRIPNCLGWIHRELQDFEGAFKFDQEGVEVGHQHHVLEAEANALELSSRTKDFKEGLTAFGESRPPNFEGR